ncbi:hypothetical protein [Marinilabilia rubra]|uniref:Uncharacterized protein n=1 Tax=Marinilabilia rubra TaxID=2162893 RepID=A0A2U2B9R4_9BACT|nr:hypothetical protein [Marinilabilia rubra]PWD99776.1 hypothetical protein DDZ16_07730 [Marinilabilia rubra]
MGIKKDKLNLIEWISKIEDFSIIYQIKKIKDSSAQSFKQSDNLSKGEKDSILRGLKDFENKNTHSHTKARKIYEKYL